MPPEPLLAPPTARPIVVADVNPRPLTELLRQAEARAEANRNAAEGPTVTARDPETRELKTKEVEPYVDPRRRCFVHDKVALLEKLGTELVKAPDGRGLNIGAHARKGTVIAFHDKTLHVLLANGQQVRRDERNRTPGVSGKLLRRMRIAQRRQQKGQCVLISEAAVAP